MSPQDFCYWLQGFLEMTDTNKMSEKQVLMIREHLKLVFNKVTPTSPDFDVAKFQKTIDEKIKEFEKRDEEAKKWGTQGTICNYPTKYC
jgi:hypothetical protein